MRQSAGKLLIFVLLLWAVGYGSAQARQITDMAGRTVTVPDVIHKIYGTSPPATLMAYAMDPSLVAGLNMPIKPDDAPYLDPRMTSRPVVGGWFGQGRVASMETLLALQPDIILVWWWQHSAMDEKMANTLAPLGIPVVYMALNQLADYPEAFDFLGMLLHRESRARTLSSYARQAFAESERVRATIPDDARVSVYYAEEADGLSTECHTSVHAELIPLSGGENVHRCIQRTRVGKQKVSMEQVLNYDPQVIVAHERLFFKHIKADPKWQNIRAVQQGRVYRIPNRPFNWFDRPPSFMRLLGLKWMLHHLYPDHTAIDIVSETRQFYRLFLNVDLDEAAARKLLAP
ncbi:ABC transporter substrate-binding protein [Desulfosarcina ovata subsp. sediminis]|uniref:ABC transporter substrate-binding protein n=1 Tax=Desulfosarcina ovata subsp. sediminis TaxID=885957 RepID=A0A5K8A256_9BACT|nr:ABC transporter substrate-binding protein [Desulfosarcina ovata]BBO86468.1 ABC transporter substrate-binding protein [Desulfosarcina ovata subsp. sediminis]